MRGLVAKGDGAVHVKEFVCTRAGVAPGEGSVFMPAAGTGDIDEAAMEGDELAGVEAGDGGANLRVGGNDVGICAIAGDILNGSGELGNVPGVSAVGLGEREIGKFAKVGHGAPAESEIKGHKIGSLIAIIGVDAKNAGIHFVVGDGRDGVALLLKGWLRRRGLDGIGGKMSARRRRGGSVGSEKFPSAETPNNKGDQQKEYLHGWECG